MTLFFVKIIGRIIDDLLEINFDVVKAGRDLFGVSGDADPFKYAGFSSFVVWNEAGR